MPSNFQNTCDSGSLSAKNSRFGFNGRELDTQGMWGGSSTYDYGVRIYNAGLGKFLSVDPICKNYPWYAPYQFAGNSPLIFVDIDGLEQFLYHIPQGTAIVTYITKSDILFEIYERVTMPENKSIVHVGAISRSDYGGKVGFGAVTYTPDQLIQMATFIDGYEKTLKYNTEYPANKQEIKEDFKNNYERIKTVIGAISLTADEILNSKNPIYVILINSDDLKKMGDMSKDKVEVLKNFVHEIDAHLEEILKGGSSEAAIEQHGKYFGFDRVKYEAADGAQI